MKPVGLSRRAVAAGSLLAALMLAGCATPPSTIPATGSAAATQQAMSSWSGRLSLRVEASPPQSFASLFELQGSPDAGELTLTSPLGTMFGRISWKPGEATLDDGRQKRLYPSVDALIAEVTGTPVPIAALFTWMRGEAVSVDGWTADLSQQAAGRLVARRDRPQPVAELRIAFEAR